MILDFYKEVGFEMSTILQGYIENTRGLAHGN